jgi:hypothetical protein
MLIEPLKCGLPLESTNVNALMGLKFFELGLRDVIKIRKRRQSFLRVLFSCGLVNGLLIGGIVKNNKFLF